MQKTVDKLNETCYYKYNKLKRGDTYDIKNQRNHETKRMWY